ncbi:MAG: hypothetical protein E6K10_05785 [Methanobacteriota archaeon]|nr:MAG: hypothetical protein E6K10_05785 [Euryarchaeota archaeon]
MSPSEGDRLPLVLAATVPILALRLGAEYLRYLGKRRLGVQEFERALLEGGMPRGPADQLAQAYREMGSLSTVLRAVRRRR